MVGPSFATRADGLEFIDAASHDEEQLQNSLAEMARVNRWLGGNRAIRRHLGECAKSVADEEPLHESGPTRSCLADPDLV